MGLYGMDRITAKPVAPVLKSGYLPYYNLGGAVTDVENDIEDLPAEFLLEQNYPNPFNPETKIVFNLPKDSNVKLKIYDVLGNEVGLIINQQRVAGQNEITLNAEKLKLASGVYLYRLEADGFTSVKKMIYLK